MCKAIDKEIVQCYNCNESTTKTGDLTFSDRNYCRICRKMLERDENIAQNGHRSSYSDDLYEDEDRYQSDLEGLYWVHGHGTEGY